VIVYSFEEFANVWRENFAKSNFTIVIQFQFGVPIESIQDEVSKIITLIYKTGRDSGLPTCLIFEEAQFFFPVMGQNPVMMSLITTGRHANISVIANTQRPASVSKLLISQSPQIYIGRLFEMNDIKYLTDTCGEISFQAKSLKQFEFIYFEQGYPENLKIITL
jgi:DNA helicase HerA-like ATPase